MTWHHVAALTLAVLLTVAVVFSPHANAAISEVFKLDSVIVGCVFAHAGTSRFQRREFHKEEAHQERGGAAG